MLGQSEAGRPIELINYHGIASTFECRRMMRVRSARRVSDAVLLIFPFKEFVFNKVLVMTVPIRSFMTTHNIRMLHSLYSFT